MRPAAPPSLPPWTRSGRLAGETETATLRVQERFEAFDPTGAYAASVVLALMALAVLLSMNLLERRRRRSMA